MATEIKAVGHENSVINLKSFDYTTALQPIHDLIRAHVLAAERLHGDDTTVPLLARGAIRQARLWTYVRDDRPFAGGAPLAALFHFSPNREKTHPNRHLVGWHGSLQADAYGGYNDLYRADRGPAPVLSALCWSHARRKFFELPDIAGNLRKSKPAHEISPVALEDRTRQGHRADLPAGAAGKTAQAAGSGPGYRPGVGRYAGVDRCELGGNPLVSG